MGGTGVRGHKKDKESTTERGRSRIGSSGGKTQKKQRRARRQNRNEGKCEVIHNELRVLELELNFCYPTRDV